MQEPDGCLSSILEKTKGFLYDSSKEIYNKDYKKSILPFQDKNCQKSFSFNLVPEKKCISSFPYQTQVSKKESGKYIAAAPCPCEKKNLDLPKDEEIIGHLCGGNLNQPYTLRLLNDLDHTIYKDKAFSLKADIVDVFDNIITLEKPILFTASLFTTTNPIQIVDRTKHNDQIITGTAICESLRTVYFKKLTIREVSSHQPHGIFNLIILPDDVKQIKPFVIRGLKVKSRKSRILKAEKRFKLTE